MKKMFYGLLTAILINLIVVSLMTIAYKGEEHLNIMQGIVILAGSILSSRIAEKFL